MYPIKREFLPYLHFTPPIRSASGAGRLGSRMRPPTWLWKDRALCVRCLTFPGGADAPLEALLLEPRGVETTRCLVYYHGGGFFFEAAGYHYLNAKSYALRAPCKLLLPRYRLAPQYPYPWPTEDCYRAFLWAWEQAEELDICRDTLAIGGDSVGGCLAAAVTQMLRDRDAQARACFQLLIYPFLDRRLDSASSREFTDAPMWNTRLSRVMLEGYLPTLPTTHLAYASPMEGCCDGLPPTYIETAEFDSLRDDGLHYAQKLRSAGIAVRCNQTRGTMHGFDIAQRAPTTQAAIAARIVYMQTHFA